MWLIQLFLLGDVMGAVVGIGAGVMDVFSSIGKFGEFSELEQIKQDNERKKALLEWTNNALLTKNSVNKNMKKYA